MVRRKRRIFIAVYHRQRLSLGENRTRLKHHAYHWGILTGDIVESYDDVEARGGLGRISTGMNTSTRTSTLRGCMSYDVSDAYQSAPDGVDLNPNREWLFRARAADPNDDRLLAVVMTGKIPRSDDPKPILAGVSVPEKDSGENCLSWTRNAVEALQLEKQDWVRDVNVQKCVDYALAVADERMKDLAKPVLIRNSTSRKL